MNIQQKDAEYTLARIIIKEKGLVHDVPELNVVEQRVVSNLLTDLSKVLEQEHNVSI